MTEGAAGGSQKPEKPERDEGIHLSRWQVYLAVAGIAVGIVCAVFVQEIRYFICRTTGQFCTFTVGQPRFFVYDHRRAITPPGATLIEMNVNDILVDSLESIGGGPPPPPIDQRHYRDGNVFARQPGYRLYLEIPLTSLPTNHEAIYTIHFTCHLPFRHVVYGDKYSEKFTRTFTAKDASVKLIVPVDIEGKYLETWTPGQYDVAIVVEGHFATKELSTSFTIEK